MRNMFKSRPLFVTQLLVPSMILVACGGPATETEKWHRPSIPDYKLKLPTDDPTLLNLLKNLKSLVGNPPFSVCDKAESELPMLEEAGKTPIPVEQEIEWKDIAHLNCDGKVDYTSHGPVKNVEEVVKIPALTGVALRNLNYATLENFRTCQKQGVVLKEAGPNGGTDEVVKDTSAGFSIDSIKLPAKLNADGSIEIKVTNSTSTLAKGFNLREGANVVQIRYFGKCQKFGDEKHPKVVECLNSETLASRTILIKMHEIKKEVAGTERTDDGKTCTPDKKTEISPDQAKKNRGN